MSPGTDHQRAWDFEFIVERQRQMDPGFATEVFLHVLELPTLHAGVAILVILVSRQRIAEAGNRARLKRAWLLDTGLSQRGFDELASLGRLSIVMTRQDNRRDARPTVRGEGVLSRHLFAIHANERRRPQVAEGVAPGLSRTNFLVRQGLP